MAPPIAMRARPMKPRKVTTMVMETLSGQNRHDGGPDTGPDHEGRCRSAQVSDIEQDEPRCENGRDHERTPCFRSDGVREGVGGSSRGPLSPGLFELLAPSALVSAQANPALTFVNALSRVLGRVFVPLGTVGLTGIDGGVAVSAQDVLPIGDGLQVRRIPAGSIPAKVVDYQPLRDWFMGQRVGQAVDSPALAADAD